MTAVLARQSELSEAISILSEALRETRKRRAIPDIPSEPVDFRTAAHALAISWVAAVALERGIWP